MDHLHLIRLLKADKAEQAKVDFFEQEVNRNKLASVKNFTEAKKSSEVSSEVTAMAIAVLKET